MADYTTTVTLRSDVSDVVSGFAKATAAIERFEAAAKRSSTASNAGMSGMASGAAKAEQAQTRVAQAAQRAGATVEAANTRAASSAERVVSASRRTEDAHQRAGQAATRGAQTVDAANTRAAASSDRVVQAATRTEQAHQRAGQSATRASAQTEQATSRTAAAMDRASSSAREFAKATALSVGGLVVAGGIAKLGSAFIEFDSAMSGVQANTRATGAELASLREAAIQAGAATKYSATEAAQGVNELAKAGVSTKDILGGGLKGALDLAAAGQLDVGEAAETAASAMTQFGLSGRDVPRIADMLSNAANNAQGSVHDMGAALNQTGLVAHGFGMSMQDTVTALTLFAQAGMTGSDAGTSLKTMIQRLQNPTDQARAAMQQLGLQVYDSSGKFVGMRAVFDQLQTSTQGMTQAQRDAALATIFGADAVRGANAAIQSGAAGWDKAAAAVTRWGGAAEQARALNDNLKGDLEQLGGSLETLFIRGGGLADGLFRPIVQGVTGLVNVLGQIPAPVMGAVAALTAMNLLGPRLGTAFTSATTGARGFFTAMSEARAAAAFSRVLDDVANGATRSTGPLTSMSVSARALGTSMGGLRGAASGLLGVLGGPWGLALAAGATALTIFSQRAAESQARVQELTAAYQADGNAVGEYTQKAMATQAVQDGVAESAKVAGQSMTDYSRAIVGTGENYAAYRDQLRGVMEAHRTVHGQYDAVGRAAQNMYDSLENARHGFWDMQQAGASTDEAMAAFGAAAGQAGDSAQKLGEGASSAGSGLSVINGQVQASGEAASGAADKFNSLVQAIAGLGSVVGGQREAVRGYEAALDAASDAAAKNGRTLDIGTEKGRANASALDNIASATLNVAAKSLQAGESVSAVSARVEAGRAAFLTHAQAMGMDAASANALADSLGLIPSQVATEVQARGLDIAGGQINDFKGTLEGIDGKSVAAQVTADTAPAQGAVSGFLAAVTGSSALAQVGANTTGALGALAGFLGTANASTGTTTVGANASPALGVLAGFLGQANGSTGVPRLLANPAPAQATLSSWLAGANGSSGTTTLKANAGPAKSTLGQTTAAINGSSGTMTIKGQNAPAIGATRAAVANANGSTGTIRVAAATGAANAAIDAAARTRTAYINVVQRVTSFVGGIFGNADGGTARTRIPGHATGGDTSDALHVYPHGGAVTGPGTTTSDSIVSLLPSGVVRLSDKEHIWTAAEVAKAGGQQAMYALRAAVRAGAFRVPGYATGGATGGPAGATSYTRVGSNFVVLTPGDVTRARSQYLQDQSAKMDAAKANYEALQALNKAKRGTWEYADATVKAAAASDRLREANATLAASGARVGSVAGQARQTITRQWVVQTAASNLTTKAFLDDIETIQRRGYPGLAGSILEMGEEKGGALAKQAARLANPQLLDMARTWQYGANQEARRARVSTGIQDATALTDWAAGKKSQLAASAAFTANLKTLQQRGYGRLALALLDEGEDTAGPMAAQAAKASAATLNDLQGTLGKITAAGQARKDLTSILHGGGPNPNRPMWSIDARDFARATVRAATTATSGPAQPYQRPIPVPWAQTAAASNAGRSLVGAQAINIYETRSGYHTAQQVDAALTWALSNLGGAA